MSRVFIKSILRWPLLVILAALLLFGGVILLFRIIYQQNPRLTLDFDQDNPTAAQLMQLESNGFFPPEHNKDFGYRWTKPKSNLTYNYLARADYKLRVWVLGPPVSGTPAPLTIKANDQVVASFAAPTNSAPQLHEIEVPANLITDGALKFQVEAPAYEVPNDKRGKLGVLFTRIELERLPGRLLIPPRTLLIALATLALLWILILAGPVLAGLTPGLRRWWFWVATVAVAIGQLLLVANDYAGQPFSLAPGLSDLLYNLGRLAIIEYAIVACIWLSRGFLKWAIRDHQPDPIPTTQKQLDALTSLRYIAALLVMGYHMPLDPDIPFGIYGFLRQGFVGVSLFYVLSGFILCYNYFPAFQNGLSGSQLKKFWFARFARIYPMYILTLTLSLFVKNSFQQVDPVLAVIHVFALQSYLPDKNQVIYAFNGPSWSVSVEIFFYALFPVLIYFGIRYLNTARRLLVAGVIVWVAQLGWQSFSQSWGIDAQEYLFYRFGPGRVCEFAIGLLIGRLFLLWRNRPVKKWEIPFVSILTAIGVVVVINIMFLEKSQFQVYRYGTIYAPAFACLVFWLARYSTPVSRVMAQPALVLLGEASYSFYLLHDLVIRAMTNQYVSTFSGIAQYLLFGLIIIVTTLLSIIAFHWYETPTRLWLRKWFNRAPAEKVSAQPLNLKK